MTRKQQDGPLGLASLLLSGALRRLGARPSLLTCQELSSGFPQLDQALGRGIPRGRIVELFGPPSSGKLSLALKILASSQASGAQTAFVDPQGTLDPAHASRLGVDLQKLVLLHPRSPHEAFGMASTLVASDSLGVVVFDLAAPLKGQRWDPDVVGDGLRRLVASLDSSKTALLIVNRISEGARHDPGGSDASQALKHFASIRMHILPISWIRRGADIVGCRAWVRVVKNKVASPFGEAEVEILYEPDAPGIEGELSFL